MLIYVVIGIIFMFLIEFLNHTFEKQLEYFGEESHTFNMLERILGMLLWPLIILLYIRSLLK
jgi:hypothetical protein